MSFASRAALILNSAVLCFLAALLLVLPPKGQAVIVPIQYIDLGDCLPGSEVRVPIRLLNPSSHVLSLAGVELH